MKRTRLSLPYVWRIGSDSAYLDFRYFNVAHVVRSGDGAPFRTVIQFRQRRHEAGCASIAQGVYFVERWISTRVGLPGGGRVHWYDALRPPSQAGCAHPRTGPIALLADPVGKPKPDAPAFTPWMDGAL